MTHRTTSSGDALHEFFGAEPDSYNHIEPNEYSADDGTGRPGIAIVGTAIQFWVIQHGQGDPVPTVGEAARVFAMPAEAVAQAVEAHPWMVLGGSPDQPLAERRILPYQGGVRP